MPATETTDAADLANQELAEAAVPTVETWITDVGPLGSVLYLRDAAYAVLDHYTSLLSGAGGGDVDDGSEPVQVLAVLAQVAGLLDGACVLLGVISPEQAAP